MMDQEAHWRKYQDHVLREYDGQSKLKSFLAEMRMAYAWTLQNQRVEFIEKDGGFALISSSQKRSDKWMFGFVVWPNEDEKKQRFWSSILELAKDNGAAMISGPIQGTTYFPYRFVLESDDSPFFKGEYFSKPEDHRFMMGQNPNRVNFFRSGYRTTFNGIMDVSKPYYDAAVQKGFSVKTYSEVSETLFRDVFKMVGEIFGGNWNFSEMSAETVQAFYAHEFGAKQRMAVQTLHLNDELIGFCRYVENDAETLICKTLGIRPAYQKLGLGNAAVYEMHRCAISAGYSKMIYALIYDGNRVQQNMPKDDSIIFRKYAAYEFDLNDA